MQKPTFFIIMCLLCTPVYTACTTLVSPKKIVIVGAGLAGLTAAYRLHQKGFDVTVYEARNRVGGRIFSAVVNGHIAELGGENLVDGDSFEHIQHLVQELGIALHQSETRFNTFFHHNNRLLPVRELIAAYNFDLETLHKKLGYLQKTSASMHEVLEKLFTSDTLLRTYFDTALAGYEGAAAAQLSPLYITTLYYMIQGGICQAHQDTATRYVRIKEGNSTLPQTLAAQLGDRVHLATPIASIAKNTQNQYIVTSNNGDTTTADILILAIPCPVYNDIVFDEQVISADRLAAIRNIQNGTNAKIIVPITGSFSQATILMNKRMGIFSYVENMVTLYFRGASSSFNADTIAQRYAQEAPLLACGFNPAALPSAEPIIARDELFAQYQGPVGHSWPSDPYAQGSYSYVGVGKEALLTTLQEHNGVLVKALFAPIDEQLYFAGEHTSTLLDIPGTMEAACQSGDLVASMIEILN